MLQQLSQAYFNNYYYDKKTLRRRCKDQRVGHCAGHVLVVLVTWLWPALRRDLAGSFRLVMPELRGSGRSDKPDLFYTVPMLADDVVGVMDALDIRSANLLGVGLGGCIAQHLAASRPERVERLALVSTFPGWGNQLGPDGSTILQLLNPLGRDRRDRCLNCQYLYFSDSFLADRREVVEAIVDQQMAHPQPAYAYYRQFLAAATWDGAEAARRITAPTLVMGGMDDPLAPVFNVEHLSELIPDVRASVLEGRHYFFIEHPRTVLRYLRDFLIPRQTSIFPMAVDGE